MKLQDVYTINGKKVYLTARLKRRLSGALEYEEQKKKGRIYPAVHRRN